jgi:hypothetical protein
MNQRNLVAFYATPFRSQLFVDITTSPENLASQQVIRANGGVLVEEFVKLPELGGTPELRFRIDVRELR